MNKKEIRALETIEAVEVESDEMKVSGYALRFNSLSNDLGGFVEEISPEALENCDMSDVRLLINHDPSYVLGRTTSETLTLTVDEIGLRFDAVLPNTSYARDLYENIRLQNVNQCSFGFILNEDGDTFEKRESDGLFKRTLNSIRSLFDVSIVTYPAYNSSDVAVAQRSIDSIKEEERQAIQDKHDAEQRKQELEIAKLQLELLRLKKY